MLGQLACTCAGLVRGNAFLEEGKEYVYQEWGIQNAGTMDYSPSAAGISWRSSVRIQVSPSLHTVQCTVLYTLDCTTHQQQGYLGGHPFAFRSAIEEGYRQKQRQGSLLLHGGRIFQFLAAPAILSQDDFGEKDDFIIFFKSS